MSVARKPSSTSLAAEASAAMEICAVGNARLAARRLTQFLAKRLEPAGLGVAQFWLLAQVASENDESLGALAQRAGLDQPTLSRNLQVLEREGLVGLVSGGEDARRRVAWLTGEGKRRLAAALEAWRSAQAEIEATVDVAELKRFEIATRLFGRD